MYFKISLTLALQREEAGPVALLRTLNCVVGFALQKIFLDVPLDLLRYSNVNNIKYSCI